MPRAPLIGEWLPGRICDREMHMLDLHVTPLHSPCWSHSEENKCGQVLDRLCGKCLVVFRLRDLVGIQSGAWVDWGSANGLEVRIGDCPRCRRRALSSTACDLCVR